MQDRKTQQREAILAECMRRGIKVERRGNAFALSGPGVSVLAADLADIGETDLQPYQPRSGAA